MLSEQFVEDLNSFFDLVFVKECFIVSPIE